MTSILFLIATIYGKQFRYNYVENQKFFLKFFYIFEIKIKFWTFSKKRWLS